MNIQKKKERRERNRAKNANPAAYEAVSEKKVETVS